MTHSQTIKAAVDSPYGTRPQQTVLLFDPLEDGQPVVAQMVVDGKPCGLLRQGVFRGEEGGMVRVGFRRREALGRVPRLLDLFCKAGGATKGYQRAGFHVTGVDIEPQPRYCGDAFHQADALEFVQEHGREFDAIAASPPCQGYSQLRFLPWLRDKVYPLLIDPTRDVLNAVGCPWIIENVEGSPLGGIVLCGRMFDLPVYRHRRFEGSFDLDAPHHETHDQVIGSGRMLNDRRKGTLNASSGGGAFGKGGVVTVAGNQFKKADGEKALGIDWMTKNELAQAIPPAYTEYLGRQLLAEVETSEVVIKFWPSEVTAISGPTRVKTVEAEV